VDPIALRRALQATVVVRLMPKTKETIEKFVDHIWSLPETMAVMLQSGADDVVVHLGVPDPQRLRDLVIDKIASFPGVVDERSSLVFEYRRKPVLSVLS
jgi:DNA-binding Lrp family transcriptional regulator